MQCRFCDNPAAHPATGQQYTATFIACRDCTVRFNAWMLSHVNGKGRGRRQQRIAAEFQPAMSFYEAAALFPSTRNNSQP
jgi:hypothetical protein